MALFEMILNTKIPFPKKSEFDPEAKDLIKALTNHDLSKRYGNLHRGVDDIKLHKFFSGGENGKSRTYFTQILHQINPAPYVPKSTYDSLRQSSFSEGISYMEIPENCDEIISPIV